MEKTWRWFGKKDRIALAMLKRPDAEAGLHNDVPALARRFANRTHFVHLRSTNVFPDGRMFALAQIEGMMAVVKDEMRTFVPVIK